MKTLKSFFFSFLLVTITTVAFAQTKTEKIAVSGECEMCKRAIEKAAKGAGASYAIWDANAKILTVKYKSTSTNTAKIEKAVAGIGYDTEHAKASDEAYDKLHACCQYERNPSAQKAHACCGDAKCKETTCFTDGKCLQGLDCCKEAGCDNKDCCKKPETKQ